ncbi:MAG: winged helix-turn-helix domain-containing protein [Patescibacteria group bacterium]
MNARDLERVLKAAGNRRRILILRYLKKNGAASVGDISFEVDVSLKATSKHLGVLLAAGFLERDQRGYQAFYRIARELPPFVKTLLSTLV